jgi:putative ABC transport system ATP-binding protein
MNTIACDQVSLTYREGSGRSTRALYEVSLEITPGSFTGIMGPSGSGKSSLLYILSGLKRPTEGSARFGDRIFRGLSDASLTQLRKERFGFVFQQPFLLSYLTALENVMVAAHGSDAADRQRAQGLLDLLGIADLSHKQPAQLSGGERQRVSVARAMMNDPEVIFADEPTAALDRENAYLVMTALARWRGRGTVIIVTHDPEMVSDADRVVRLQGGLVLP